ncbi:MAG: hypothetical protein P1P90_01585 [Patescibacteria group bacterium]|nr:hypothetical protein [Patescibacteria group bacterium]
MPRKKATNEDEVITAAPKRTRRTASKRVASAASTPAPERPRIMSSEEKRQLILAHAAMRQPVDTVQRFSLWTGVIVCVLAIAIGWVYTMRQTIAGAIGTNETGTTGEVNYGELKSTIHDNINVMVEEIDSLQEDHLMDLREQAAILQTIDQINASTSADNATTSAQMESSGHSDLFQPSNESSETPSSNDFQIPPGVTIDAQNAN